MQRQGHWTALSVGGLGKGDRNPRQELAPEVEQGEVEPLPVQLPPGNIRREAWFEGGETWPGAMLCRAIEFNRLRMEQESGLSFAAKADEDCVFA